MTADSRRRRGRHRRRGWRPYAVLILAIVTVAVVGNMRHHDRGKPVSSNRAQQRVSGNPATRVGTGGKNRRARVDGTRRRPSAARIAVEGMGNPAAAHYRPGATRWARALTIRLADDGPGACADNDYSQLVVVSIRQQHLWACARHRQINSTPVTTGMSKDDDRTPLGSWRVQAKQRDRYLTGPGYRDYVQYWVPFNGDFGFHDASWQTIPFGSPQYHTKGSHGCVHLPTTVMAWLYHWASVYDTVVTIEK